jgi:hypothetical protein
MTGDRRFGGAQPEPGFGGGEHPPRSSVGAQPEPGFGGGEHPPTVSALLEFELMRTWIRVEHDIFAVRQRGREVAAGLGLDHQDQVRVATALTELGRAVLGTAGGAEVRFAVRLDVPPALSVRLRASHPAAGQAWTSIAPVAGLVDDFSVSGTGEPLEVAFSRRVGAGVALD